MSSERDKTTSSWQEKLEVQGEVQVECDLEVGVVNGSRARCQAWQ